MAPLRSPVEELSMPARPLVLLGLSLAGCGTFGLESTLDSGDFFDPGPGPGPDFDSDDPDDTRETDPGVESAPELESFELSERSSDSTIQVVFEAFDLDGDLVGGRADLSLGGQSYSFDIPGELDQYSATGSSRFHIDASSLDPGQTVNGVMTLVDAAGHRSETLTDSLTMSGSVFTVSESGDTEDSAQDLGAITLPTIIQGNISRASNDGYGYTGDIDWIQIRVASRTDAHFSLSWEASGSDYDLHLLVNGETEAQSIQDGATQPESFTRTLQPGTSYVIVVAGWQGSAGNYTLTIDAP
jgi:hypothetical protein